MPNGGFSVKAGVGVLLSSDLLVMGGISYEAEIKKRLRLC